MAIIVDQTTVIDDSYKLQNIEGANGKYDAFHPNVVNLISSPSVTVSMNNPYMGITLEGNATLNATNLSVGRTSILSMDTSASAFTPSFSSNVKWSNDTEPTWSDFRFWNIAFVCWDSSNARATAVGFDS